MADDPKTSMTRAEYDARIIRHSREVLAQSYRVLRETDGLLPYQGPRSVEPSSNLKPTHDGG